MRNLKACALPVIYFIVGSVYSYVVTQNIIPEALGFASGIATGAALALSGLFLIGD